MSNEISQEELNSFNLSQDGSLDKDLKNIIILITNELNTLENSVDYYDQKTKNRMKKKLNKVLNEIIDIRKH